MLNEMISAGKSVKIVCDIDLVREEIVMRNSFVYEVRKDKVIVAQTDPPFTKKHIGKEVVVTYLDKHTRLGFHGKISKIIGDFRLENNLPVEAIVIKPLGKPAPYNLRRYARVKTPSSLNIRFYVSGVCVNLIDISVGGAFFSYHKVPDFYEGDVLKSVLMVNGRTLNLESKIVRVDPPDPKRLDLYHVSCEFVNTPPHVKKELTTIIFEIEKEIRSFLIGQGKKDS